MLIISASSGSNSRALSLSLSLSQCRRPSVAFGGVVCACLVMLALYLATSLSSCVFVKRVPVSWSWYHANELGGTQQSSTDKQVECSWIPHCLLMSKWLKLAFVYEEGNLFGGRRGEFGLVHGLLTSQFIINMWLALLRLFPEFWLPLKDFV